MKVIVCGAGAVGTSIAQQLALENNDVTIIDQSSELLHEIEEEMDVKVLEGFASHPDVLERAGASETDLLIAVTKSDEVNMVACQIAHSIFNVPTKIARIRNEHYLHPLWHDLYRRDHLPIDVIISPEVEVAEAIFRRLHLPGSLDMVPFAGGKVRMVAVRCMMNCARVGRSYEVLKEEAAKDNLKISILGVVREGRFILPEDVKKFYTLDDVYFLVPDEDMRRAMRFFGHDEEDAHRIVILGGGNVGFYLAQLMENDEEHEMKARVVEFSHDRAEYIAEQLRRTHVIHGSAMDRDILHEANIGTAETVIAVTNDDKVNILASLLAKREGAERAFALVNDNSYTTLVNNLGVDAVISPRETTVSSILQHVRRGRVRGLHTIRDGLAEVIEAEVGEQTRLAGKIVGALDLPRGVMLAAILRDGQMLLPEEEMSICPGDHVLMLSIAGMGRKVEQMFTDRIERFVDY